MKAVHQIFAAVLLSGVVGFALSGQAAVAAGQASGPIAKPAPTATNTGANASEEAQTAALNRKSLEGAGGDGDMPAQAATTATTAAPFVGAVGGAGSRRSDDQLLGLSSRGGKGLSGGGGGKGGGKAVASKGGSKHKKKTTSSKGRRKL